MFIFDASTLILLAKTQILEPFLISVRLQVAIPAEVANECCGARKTLDALVIQKHLDESRIKVIQVKDKKIVARLQSDFSLGRGEAEAIALALKEKARIIGIDDKNGINACKLLGLPFTTAIGILLRSREKGLLDRDTALAALAARAAFGRYKSSIIEDARQKLEAR
jgi:predicted nucleic acid-binding protein